MKTKRACMAGLIALTAGSASGQFTATLNYTIEWENAPSPGVAAKGAVWATIDPEVGTAIQWLTPPGTGQLGPIKAFAATIFDVGNAQNATTGTLSWTLTKEFNSANKPGTPDGDGGIVAVYAGQFGPLVNPNPVVTTKVKLLDLEWSTDDFSNPRFVEFTTKAAKGWVWLDVGLMSGYWVGQKCNLVDGSDGFWVVPAPSGLALMGLASVACGRRRRTR